MPISSTSLNPSSGASAPASQTQSPSAKPPKHDDSSSTIVTLSEQGKKLSQSQQNAASQANQAQQNAQTHQQNAHASKPSGVPAIEGDNKNSRVSTYA
jgi:hypothetical protein